MLDKIKKLRELTGVGVVEVKKALEEARGDEAEAKKILKIRGQEKASKKQGRTANEGTVVSYVHGNGRVGAMVKLLSETDFVARNKEFKDLAYDIAMHIAAMNPKYIKPEDVPEDVLDKEREIWKAQMADQKKPAEILKKIIEGKEKKYREEASLLSQPFVKNPEVTVGELIAEMTGKIGENIQVGEFCRIEL